MKYDELIHLCIELIKSYNPIIMTIDSHSEQFVKEHQRQLFDTEAVFLKQVFYGTSRYEEFLKVFTNALFKQNTSTTNRNDTCLYNIFTYLICFRLDELPYTEFKKMVVAIDAVKMNVFLQFLFDIDKLQKYVREGWIQIYDPDYIDNTIINGIQEKLPQVTELLAQLSEKATGKKSDLVNTLEQSLSTTDKDEKQKQKKKDPTQPIPFNLTQPKPKAIPEPIKIPKIVERKPINKAILYDVNLQKIEDDKKKRLDNIKQQVKKTYQEDSKQPFNFQLDKRNLKKQDKVVAEMVRNEESALQFNNKYAFPMPDYKNEESDVKFNVAAILREEKILKKKEEEEKKKLEDLEQNLRDSTEFENWSNEQKAKEKIERLEHMQRKKIEMELSRESAIKAYNEKVTENKKTVIQMKTIAEEKVKEKEEIVKEIWDQKHKLIETVLETRDNAVKEKVKLLEKNKKIHDENKKQLEIIFDKKKEEDELERKKRVELIRQIRELEMQPKKRTKGYDPTETAGLGLLEEMSLVELREKLDSLKLQREQERENKRQDNLQKKDIKIQSYKEKVEFIKKNRTQLAQSKDQERQDKKKKEEEDKKRMQEIREKSLLEVHQKIYDKKYAKQMEEERLAKELKEIQLKRQYMNANAAIVEENAWKSQQEGAEREIKQRQIDKLIDQERLESIKYKERKILADSAKKLVETKIQFNQQYDENMERANKENEILYRQLRDDKKAIYTSIKEYEQEHAKNVIERDNFKQKISEMSLTNAKIKKQQTTNAQKSKFKSNTNNNNNDSLELPGPKYDDVIQVQEQQKQQPVIMQ